MLDWMDEQQQKLADNIDPTQNNVGHFIKQIYLAQGGVTGGSGNIDTSLSSSDMAAINSEAKQGVTGADSSTERAANTGLGTGQGFYNSPVYIASHYSQLGKFFTGAEPGNAYTNRYTVPQKTPAPQSEDPDIFYAKWYSKMRQFAQAEEVSGAGQAEVRSR